MPPPGDGDPETSDGIFVYTSKTPLRTAAAGNAVCVSGVVAEYVPSSDPTSPSQTEIDSPEVTLVSMDNPLPEPVVLAASDTDPAGDVLQLEKYEGMRVEVESLTVVGPTRGTIDETDATSKSAGIFYGVIPGIARPFTQPGVALPGPLPPGSPCCVPRSNANPEVLSVNSLGLAGGHALDVTTGQAVSNIVGPLEYTGRVFTIDAEPSDPPVVSGDPLTFAAAPEPDPAELTIASFNMQRFYDTSQDPGLENVALTPQAFANRLNKASLTIRNVLHYPDILGVEEMGKLTTLQTLAGKIDDDAASAGDPAPNYQAYLMEGNDISGINVGFLVKTPKVRVIDITQYGKDATYTNPVSNARVTLNDRPPLVLRASVASMPVTVIVNHLLSVTSIDDPTDGARIRAKREAQAEYLANLIQEFQNSDPGVNLVSIGDYNAYQFNDGYVDVLGVVEGTPVPANEVMTPPATITNPTLIDLMGMSAPSEQYSYVYNGAAQELDHVLVNQNMAALASRYAVARTNADFPEVYRNDTTRPERVSDHDIPVAYFRLPLGIANP